MKLLALLSFLLVTGYATASPGSIIQSDTLPSPGAEKKGSSSTRMAPAPMIMPGVRLDTAFNALPVQNPTVGKAAPAWLRAKFSGSPMYVVDGKSATAAQLKTMRQADVASVKVLDGSRAAALYGKNARSGMVIITTRKAANR
jgi:hypothetical protein